MFKMKISVLGCGRWGSLIAWYLNKISHNVTLWGRENSENLRNLIKNRKNSILMFPENMIFTCDLKFVIKSADIVIISINAQSFRNFLESNIAYKNELESKPLILCMKGIETETGKRLSEIATEYLPNSNKIAVWVGPGHVQTFSDKIPTCMVIDSNDKSLIEKLAHEFTSEFVKFYYGSDLVGTEIGASAKNIIGIAAGILDGVGYESLKGPLMSRACFEIANLIRAMGGKEKSAYGLANLGDFQATLFSEHSHNRRFGEALVTDKKIEKMPEGFYNSKAFMVLSKKYKVELPICEGVYEIIHESKNPKEILKSLLKKPISFEF